MDIADPMPWAGDTRFGVGWACFDGIGGDAKPHRHLAAQLVVGLTAEVRVQGRGCFAAGPAVLVRAGAVHTLQPSPNPVRVIYLEGHSPLALACSALGRGEDLVEPPAALVERLRAADDLDATLQGLADECPGPDLDTRLAAALARLTAAPRPGDIASAARAVGLSEPRLRAIATQYLGAPLSQWRLWFMLERALGELRSGETLAAAAAIAGFSDQAHLSRTMRRFMGVTPKTMWQLLRQIRMVAR